MKLLRLKLTDTNKYRSLQPGFEINFRNKQNLENASSFNPYILAGPNGSGKSNLLEILGSIFFHIECMYLNYRPESFEYDEENNPSGFQGSVSSPDAFELEYLIWHPYRDSQREMNPDSPEAKELCHIEIIKNKNESPKFYFKNWETFPTEKQEEIKQRNIKFFLPTNIIAYSSGENEIISLPFYKMRFIHFDEYRNILKKDSFYGQVPEGRLVYLDEHLNQSILLSNFLMQCENDLKIFDKVLNLSDIKQFSIIIGKHHFETFHEDILKNLSLDEQGNDKYSKIELTSKLSSTLDKLIKCATCNYSYFDEESEKEYLLLDYYVTDETKNAFKFHFENNPLILFQALQILHTLNYCIISEKNRERIYSSQNIYLKQDLTLISLDDNSIFRIKDLRLNKGNIKDVIYTRSLSDGEHQLLHSIGLAMLYKNTNSLFLLDEPETHFNPDWRAKFVSILRNCFDENTMEKYNHEMLITTHTPYLISDSKKDYVLVFDKNNDKVTVSRPDYNTLGSSINKITMLTFRKTETIGAYAEKQLNELKERYNTGESVQALIDETNLQLGDSVEKVLFLKQLLDSDEDK